MTTIPTTDTGISNPERPEATSLKPVSGLPEGFSLRDDGIYLVASDGKKDDELIEEFLCSPVEVTERFHRRDGTGWGRMISVTNPLGEEHHFPLMDRSLKTERRKVLEQLADLGLRIGRVVKADGHIVDLLNRWEPPVTKLSTERRGWADERCEAFVLGERSIIGDSNVIPVAMDLSPIADAIGSKGKLTSWRTDVAALCTGNPLMMVAVSQAFVGPLLELLGRDGGGLHLRGRSSQGKTTLQRAAGSVWGKPSFTQGWRTTANALETTAAACNGMLLILDELGEVLGRDLDAATYMLANGKGKARATPFGGHSAQRTWKVAILSSGEISISEKIEEGGRSAMRGQQVRLIDVVADTRLHGAFDDLHGCMDGAAFAKQVSARAAMTYGTAGPAFVKTLLLNREIVLRVAKKLIEGFRDAARHRFDISVDGPVERVLDWFALLNAAGQLATYMKITGWPTGAAQDAALEIFGEWLDAWKPYKEPSDRATTERTRNFLKARSSEFVEVKGAAGAIPAPIGWKDNKLFYITKATWALIHDGTDAAVAARALEQSGFLLPGEGANLARKAPRDIPGRPRVYTIKALILGESDEGDSHSASLKAA